MSDVKIEDLVAMEASNSPRAAQMVSIRERREQCMKLWLRGWTKSDIARELGVTPTTIGNDISVMEAEYSAAYHDRIDDVRVKQMARVEQFMAEAWEAWEASKQADEELEEIVEVAQGDAGGALETRSTRKLVKRNNTGNPAVLAQIRWAIAEMNRMAGVYAPKRHTIINKHIDIDKFLERLSASDLQRIALGEDITGVILDSYSGKRAITSQSPVEAKRDGHRPLSASGFIIDGEELD